MSEKELNLNEIVKIETMPKIFEQLEVIGKYIDESLKDIDKLECTEENKQMVKKKRAEINNTLKVLESKRLEIKRAINEPYEVFNAKYEETIKNKLNEADNALKMRINAIEEEQLNSKRDILIDFAIEYFKKYNMPAYVTFESIGLNITLSASEKSLKEQIVSFCERINSDLQLIRLEEYGAEIENEYMLNNFDYAKAKLTVIERHNRIEELEKQKQANQIIKEQQEKIIEEVNSALDGEITAPQEIVDKLNEDIKFEERFECSFKVWATKEELMKIKELLKELGVKYE